MVHAVGLGIRYRTPVGPLRLDLAYSVIRPIFMDQGHPARSAQRRRGSLQSQHRGPLPGAERGHFQFFFSIGQTF